ncbi:SDR family oxidoreductase [Rhodococcus triatomae]|uniref:NAD(P)-dependent dehydrogenase, short-chain alcohol dehydrogenase family n=1 Tax=Rhodococcus triatomae TaxID=300028 RepID=A0A1G8BB94_9NOCA|nr:SDR family oxidoreductase [Rhodococcus triatomae]QNG17481.1 SDR family oxidoreductase [Rhodococcus triatomae]QNG22851.1 SDR family oxidoreductase [Rhodococcus triatomae]SDH30351.1 NAD(P)-dependent dehydrogenase, short-chain alcohol dehydrogenase family [Rhodococcus triatomae]
MDRNDLNGQVTLVTGGVRGVGAGISRAFLAAGATVVTCARRPADELVEAAGRQAEFRPCDVRDPEQVATLIDGIVADHGRLDILVNNAGGAPFALAAEASPNFHAKIVELNLLAPLLVAQTANAVMQRQETGGAIVNISSVSGSRPSPGTAAYGAAKAGIDSLTGSLAVEWAPKVRVNSVVVGLVRTEQAHLHYGDEAGIEAVAATVPLGRMAFPEDVGHSAVFLASSRASYVSGSTLTVHGGGERPAFLAAADTESPART